MTDPIGVTVLYDRRELQRARVNVAQVTTTDAHGRAHHGDMDLTPLELRRFWRHVEKTDDCWWWRATQTVSGYGRPMLRRWLWTAHRLSWVIANGPIPDGLSVCHTCDNRLCVNPAHLWLGTNGDNNRDCHAKKRSAYHRGTLRYPRLSGEAHPRHKLALNEVRAIRSAYANGVDALTLAGQYGVSRNQIYLIGKGKAWAKD
jgi:hypothetical protein